MAGRVCDLGPHSNAQQLGDAIVHVLFDAALVGRDRVGPLSVCRTDEPRPAPSWRCELVIEVAPVGVRLQIGVDDVATEAVGAPYSANRTFEVDLLLAVGYAGGIEVVAELSSTDEEATCVHVCRLDEQHVYGRGQCRHTDRLRRPAQPIADCLSSFDRHASRCDCRSNRDQPRLGWLSRRRARKNSIGVVNECADADEPNRIPSCRPGGVLHEFLCGAKTGSLGKTRVAEFTARPISDLAGNKRGGCVEGAARVGKAALGGDQALVVERPNRRNDSGNRRRSRQHDVERRAE